MLPNESQGFRAAPVYDQHGVLGMLGADDHDVVRLSAELGDSVDNKGVPHIQTSSASVHQVPLTR